MTDNDKCPPPKEVQDFLFKQASVSQICEEFQSIPTNSNLIVADGKRGLLYLGHENKLIVVKSGHDSNPEWKLELDLPDKVTQVTLSCDCSFLAVIFNQPSALIYDADSIHKHKLDLLHELRLSTNNGSIIVSDVKWNPAIPEMLCSITNDHTIGCFQVSRDKKIGVQIIGLEKPQGLEAMCVSWSPKGKQLVIGCKSGFIVQLKPELKIARVLSGPNPNEGMIISILWVSNYQFCACYFHPIEERISVMIVDAPKGVTAPKYTNYEDITFGSGSLENLNYYFEHIAEWGIVIAASSHSSEVAVLGTSDNGKIWNLWQLMDDSTAQLPLDRKKKTENYPVGITIDKSATQKLPWGNESTLPNPVPILRILVTSGQLCCYHMVNLKENAPAICVTPTEIISTPLLPRPSLGPSEVSFNLHTGVTSTPRLKQTTSETNINRPKLTTNMFGDSSFSFLAPGNKEPSENFPQIENKNLGFSSTAEAKPTELFGQGDGKTNLFQQENKVNKPTFMPQVDQQVKPPMSVLQQQNIQPEIKSGFSIKSDNKVESKTLGVSLSNQTGMKITKEIEKEPVQCQKDEVKAVAKDLPLYDDGICLRAYYEEQARFEKELKVKLDLPTWNCGSEDERQLLVKKSSEIEEFLRELRETTNSLASDIAYLKALLLQSFAWLEETKSKNSANMGISSRSRTEGSKLSDLQRLYNYTQSQLSQATVKLLDFESAEYQNCENLKMKIPNSELIYQSLIRYNQIIVKEKKKLDELTKKWRAVPRGGNNITSLDRSMASLNLSQSSNIQVNDTAIDLRCKLIATSTRNFSREKQNKLRDLLSESAPRITRAVRPTAIQDRLEATLSSLASLKATETSSKVKPVKPAVEQQKAEPIKPADFVKPKQTQNALTSLDNLVSGIGNNSNALPSISKSPSSTTPFSTFGTKPMTTSTTTSTTTSQIKSKENIPILFGQSNISQQLQSIPDTSKPFGKIDSINFNSSNQKTAELQSAKENLPKPAISDSSVNKFTMFSTNTFGKLGSPENQSPGSVTSTTPMMTNISSVPKTTFSFSSSITPSTTPQSFASVPKLDNTSVFKFSSKPNIASDQQISPAQGSLDLSSLSFGTRPGLSITSISEGNTQTKTTTATSPTVSPIGLTFGKPSLSQQQSQQQTPIFGQANGLSVAQPAATTQPMPIQSLFGKSSGTPATVVSSPDQATGVSSTTAVTTQLITTSIPTAASTPSATATTSSIFGTVSLSPGLSSSTLPISSFSTSPVSNQTTATTTATSSASTVSFSTPSSTIPSIPSFGGILGTKSLSLGTPSTNASITPAFSKNPAPTTANIFGSTTPSQSTFPVFGKSDANAVSSTSASPFGGTTSAATTTTASVFGSIGSGASGTLMFGGQTAKISNSENNFFAKAPASTATAPTSSIFGGSTASAPTFGSSGTVGSAFGANTTTQQSNVFGVSSTTQSSGTSSVFGAAAPSSTSIFGGASSTIASSVFGAPAATATTSALVFGGTGTTGSIFGGAASTAPAGTSVFGSSATPTASIFGAGAAATTTPGGSVFATSPNTTTAGATPQGGLMFSAASPQPATGSIFGSAATTGGVTGGSIFGAPASLGAGTSMFGGAVSPGGGLGSPYNNNLTISVGQSSSFGAKPVFGSPSAEFGAKPTFASGFGSPPSFGGAPASTGFGSSPIIGAGSQIGGTSPNKVFGSSTFEALGSQSGGLSFGSLAQKTSEPEKPPAFQGSSSFSSWR